VETSNDLSDDQQAQLIPRNTHGSTPSQVFSSLEDTLLLQALAWLVSSKLDTSPALSFVSDLSLVSLLKLLLDRVIFLAY
jgi:hypothetical protein